MAEETTAERIAREKREAASGGEKGSDSTSNTSDATGATGATGPGSRAKVQDDAKGTNVGKTGGKTTTVNDGTPDGQQVKEVQGSRIPQANDVIEGRHVGRTPEEKGPRETDGSKSPHDETSDGGSRQAAALSQTDPEREDDDTPEAAEVARDGRTGVATATTGTTRPGGAA